MKETSRPMSTIEKAASRLAARQRPNAASNSGLQVDERARRANGNARKGPGLQSDSEASLGLAPARFCEIDIEAVRERGFLLPDDGRSQLAQEMRRIKRPLLLNIQKAQTTEGGAGDSRGQSETGGPPANLIMITSALPGEGKTFSAINLAMSIAAEMDKRVLLVDADVARGDVSRQLGIAPARGLSDLLRESNHLFEDAVLTSNVDRLSILPAGSLTEQVDELYASEMMGVVTRALAETDPNRVVIFDASPLLATTEAAVLAGHMGQTVLVVEAGKTPQDAVTHAVTQLEGCSSVSLILNKSSGKDGGTYGYGYGYGHPGQDGGGSSEAREEQRSETG